MKPQAWTMALPVCNVCGLPLVMVPVAPQLACWYCPNCDAVVAAVDQASDQAGT